MSFYICFWKYYYKLFFPTFLKSFTCIVLSIAYNHTTHYRDAVLTVLISVYYTEQKFPV